MKNIFLLLFFLLSLAPLYSWTNHFIVSYFSLHGSEKLVKLPNVKVESFESFLKKEADGLAPLLEEIEQKSIETIPNYAKRPDGFVFDSKDKSNLRKNFLRSIRLNPKIKLELFIQKLPNSKLNKSERLPTAKISIFENDEWMDRYFFQSIKEGGMVHPIDIIASGADEPDYGHDIGLYTNNDTEHGKSYGFGTQPFGDPRKFYGSQAPFHMGFFHEAGILYMAGGFIKRTHPLYRILLFRELSKYAFKTGHEYWGYRFMGWGLHYIGDLTQPYHSTLSPGKTALGLISINIRSMLGFKSAYEKEITRLSDRHTALEHYEYYLLEKIIKANDLDSEYLNSFKDISNDKNYPGFSTSYPIDVLTKESNKRADELDEIIGESDSIMLFKDREVDFSKFKEDENSKKVNEFLKILFRSVGSHTRIYVDSLIKKE